MDGGREIANKGNARVDVGVSAISIPSILPADDTGGTEGARLGAKASRSRNARERKHTILILLLYVC